MKIAVLLLAVLSLAAAKPGGYHHQQYSFEQSSVSYKNNELQHKNEEQGRYTKFEDLDSPDKPQESSVYRQSEYNAPGADKEERGFKGHRRGQQTWQSNLSQRDLFKASEDEHQVVFKDEESDTPSAGSSYSMTENPDEGTTETAEDADGTTVEPMSIDSRWGHGGHGGHRHHGGHTWAYHHGGHTWAYHHGGQHQRGFHHGGGHRGGHHGNRHYGWHTPGHNHPHGSGRDYLENTEGGRPSPVVPIGTGAVPAVVPVVPIGTGAVPAVQPTVPIGSGAVPTVRPTVPIGTGAVPTSTGTSHLQPEFGQIDALAAENLGRGLLDIRSGMTHTPNLFSRMHGDVNQQEEDLTQQQEDLTQQTQDLTQQTQDLTQQTQDLTQQTQDLTQQTEDLTQQHQDGFSTLEVASQYQSNQKHDQLEDLTQQHQSHEGFGKLELGQERTRMLVMPIEQRPGSRQRTLVQQPTGRQHMTQWNQQQQQHQLEDLTQQHTSDLTQQHQDGFGTLEVGSQYQQQQQQQQQRSDKLEDLTQQTQDGFSGFEFGSQQHEDLTQQSQDLTQQSQDLTQQSQDLTQQSQDLTQQSQDLTQQHEDLTQQTQDGFGTLEFGQQQDRVQHVISENTRPAGRVQHIIQDNTQQATDRSRHTISQNTQQATDRSRHITSEINQATGRGRHTPQQPNNPNYKLYDEEQYHKFVADADDLTQQQSHSGFDKIEVEGVTHQSHSPRTSGKLEQATQQHEDLTQQHQDGFGSQYQQHRTYKLEDLTQQQSQDGAFEFGSQYQQQSNQNQDKQDLMQQHADVTQQQTQDKLGKLEFGVDHGDLTQQHEDLTQQTQDGFSNLEVGSQYQQQQQSQHKSDKLENLNQQQADLTQQHEDLTQQTQDGFGMLEIGSQYQQQSQQRSDKLEDLTQQHADLTQQHADLTQQHSDLTQQHEDLTQQTQDGFGTFEIGSQYQQQSQQRSHDLTQQHADLTQQHADLTQQHEDLTQQTQDGFGQLEVGQQHVQNGDWRTRHYQQHSQRSQTQSSTYSSRYHQLNYAHTSHTGAEETTGELVHGAVDHQHAQQVEDVSQHVQQVHAIKFDDQNEKLEDFNQRSTQEILAKKHEDATLHGREEHPEQAETEKPGFWKRVGSSITSSYESAKEKSKSLAEKVKANLG